MKKLCIIKVGTTFPSIAKKFGDFEKIINSAIYKDEFTKTKDGWKFSRHLAM